MHRAGLAMNLLLSARQTYQRQVQEGCDCLFKEASEVLIGRRVESIAVDVLAIQARGSRSCCCATLSQDKQPIRIRVCVNEVCPFDVESCRRSAAHHLKVWIAI